MQQPSATVILRRRRLLGMLGGAAVTGTAGLHLAPALGQDVRTFSIATGGLGGTYYPVGGLLADLLTAPPGGLPCRPEEACGVADMVAVAQTSDGSVENVRSLAAGWVDSAFCQADVAHQAWRGEGGFAEAPVSQLRVLASLYPEVAQLVLRDPAARRPLRIGIGAAASGTRVISQRLLQGFGFGLADVTPVDLNPGPAIDALANDDIDGFLTVAGLPTAAVDEALGRFDARLVAIDEAAADAFLRDRSFWKLRTIPPGVYPGQDEQVRTLAVAALWVVGADMEDDLVTDLLTALWSPAAALVLMAGHPAAALIDLASALDGISIPLHPAAADFYRTKGLLQDPGETREEPTAGPPADRQAADEQPVVQ